MTSKRNRVTYFFMQNIETLKKTNNVGDFAASSNENFLDLGISASILKVLTTQGLLTPTPIQRQAIPPALAGQDLIGIAQTGTGKTLAFGIPILQGLAINKGLGLVVVPTRELAIQVTESLKKLGNSFGLRLATLIGGEYIDRQLYALRKKPHVIVATPGRLLDHLKRKTLKLDDVKILVLDEADMMLDLGFAPQVEEILKQAPTNRQTMLFSATMPQQISKLAANHLKLPIRIEVAPQGTTAEMVEQEVLIVRPSDRFSSLEKIINSHSGSILVFVRTKHSVKELTKKLVFLGHKATEIHSNLSLSRRRIALDDFKTQKSRLLIATDVAARGLDVNGIELVVNYNLPDAHSDYVHRIGRTGRAGKPGKAISLATPDQLRDIRSIERLINKTLLIKEYNKSKQENNQQQPVRFSQPASRYAGKRFNRQFAPQSEQVEFAKKTFKPAGFSAAPSHKKLRKFSRPNSSFSTKDSSPSNRDGLASGARKFNKFNSKSNRFRVKKDLS